MAGTGWRAEQGWNGSGVVGASDIAANVGVKWDTNGLLVVCGAGDKGIGSFQEAAKVGVTANFVRKIGGAWMQYSSTVAAGDYVKFTTGGILVSDGTSGSTALSVNTVGVVREINAGASMCFMEWV